MAVETTVALARKRRRQVMFWFGVFWNLHLYGQALATLLALAVPFGLAALLWLPAEYHRRLNLWLLACSAVSVVITMVDQYVRFPERIRRLRDVGNRLDLALAKHADAVIDDKQFVRAVEEAFELHAGEEFV